jgi:tRNA threonylcarbamoyladenosine biosynthesis protein TsaB
MSYIINIDTATEVAILSITKDGEIIQSLQNASQKDHGAFVQTAIAKQLQSAALTFDSIDAIAVVTGPGSYTGLRVGMASAKGLSYALSKPLITISTLELWASAAIAASAGNQNALFCPMIDARRMEVFTAVYNASLSPVLSPLALILNENSFADLLDRHHIIFTGNGADKWQKICSHTNSTFAPLTDVQKAMGALSQKAFISNQFADLAYTEPFYLKEFKDNI